MDTWTYFTSVRILAGTAVLAALLSPALVVATGGMETSGGAIPQQATVVRPDITLLGDPSPEEREMVDWALARFEAAGLQLPDLSIEFKAAGCRSRGQYSRKTQTIHICDGRKMTLLHELAHAWDHFAHFQRETFLDLRGLDTYFGDPDTPAAEMGVEHVAEILAWGLMDENPAVPAPAYPSQPFKEYEPRLPGLPNSEHDELCEAFMFLTQVNPLYLPRGKAIAVAQLVEQLADYHDIALT